MASGDTAVTELSQEGEATPREEQRETLQKIQQHVLGIMHACWHTLPEQRPSTLDLLKETTAVKRLASEATVEDDFWHLGVITNIIQEIGNEEAQQNARALREQIQIQKHEKEEERKKKVLEDLQQEMNEKFKNYFIDHRCLDVSNSDVLGKGQFGVVKTAKLYKACDTRQEQEEERHRGGRKVAVKEMQHHKDTDQTSLFLKEAMTTCKLEHRNIVTVLGIVLRGAGKSYQLVMEFADGKTLANYVKVNERFLGQLSFKQILKALAIDASQGMDYIGQEKMVHGDLAARNVLLFNTGGNGTPIAKLADFGLSHKLSKGQGGTYYYNLNKAVVKSVLPVFWMAKECIEDMQREMRLSSMTDVWSFGVLLWEIFSAKKPENEMSRPDLGSEEVVADLKRKFSMNYRLPKPLYCPQRVYNIMTRCWHDNPEDRPTFAELTCELEPLSENDLS